MIILDTNIISALMQKAPDPKVVKWLDQQPLESIWTTSVNLFEIWFGLRILPDGKRKTTLQEKFQFVLEEGLNQQILEFDQAAANEAATIASQLRSKGHAIEIRDLQIAGIAKARHAILATRNVKHFVESGIEIVNPWD